MNFHRVTFKDLGLRVQLGHPIGDPCPYRESGHTKFMVIARNSIQHVNVDFCACPGHPPHFVQCLEMRWWPSTPISPQTVATMDVLRSFHVMNLQARLAPTDFYRSLERLTDGHGLATIPVSEFPMFHA